MRIVNLLDGLLLQATNKLGKTHWVAPLHGNL